MDLADARLTLRDAEAGFMAHLAAVKVLAASPDSTLVDLVETLKRDGLVAEISAAELYRRTGREFPKSPMDASADHDEWVRFLSQRGLL